MALLQNIAKKTFKVNYLLFTALKELRDHQMASLLAEDYLLDYLRDDQKLTEYVTEMIYSRISLVILHKAFPDQ